MTSVLSTGDQHVELRTLFTKLRSVASRGLMRPSHQPNSPTPGGRGGGGHHHATAEDSSYGTEQSEGGPTLPLEALLMLHQQLGLSHTQLAELVQPYKTRGRNEIDFAEFIRLLDAANPHRPANERRQRPPISSRRQQLVVAHQQSHQQEPPQEHQPIRLGPGGGPSTGPLPTASSNSSRLGTRSSSRTKNPASTKQSTELKGLASLALSALDNRLTPGTRTASKESRKAGPSKTGVFQGETSVYGRRNSPIRNRGMKSGGGGKNQQQQPQRHINLTGGLWGMTPEPQHPKVQHTPRPPAQQQGTATTTHAPGRQSQPFQSSPGSQRTSRAFASTTSRPLTPTEAPSVSCNGNGGLSPQRTEEEQLLDLLITPPDSPKHRPQRNETMLPHSSRHGAATSKRSAFDDAPGDAATGSSSRTLSPPFSPRFSTSQLGKSQSPTEKARSIVSPTSPGRAVGRTRKKTLTRAGRSPSKALPVESNRVESSRLPVENVNQGLLDRGDKMLEYQHQTAQKELLHKRLHRGVKGKMKPPSHPRGGRLSQQMQQDPQHNLTVHRQSCSMSPSSPTSPARMPIIEYTREFHDLRTQPKPVRSSVDVDEAQSQPEEEVAPPAMDGNAFGNSGKKAVIEGEGGAEEGESDLRMMHEDIDRAYNFDGRWEVIELGPKGFGVDGMCRVLLGATGGTTATSGDLDSPLFSQSSPLFSQFSESQSADPDFNERSGSISFQNAFRSGSVSYGGSGVFSSLHRPPVGPPIAAPVAAKNRHGTGGGGSISYGQSQDHLCGASPTRLTAIPPPLQTKHFTRGGAGGAPHRKKGEQQPVPNLVAEYRKMAQREFIVAQACKVVQPAVLLAVSRRLVARRKVCRLFQRVGRGFMETRRDFKMLRPLGRDPDSRVDQGGGYQSSCKKWIPPHPVNRVQPFPMEQEDVLKPITPTERSPVSSPTHAAHTTHAPLQIKKPFARKHYHGGKVSRLPPSTGEQRRRAAETIARFAIVLVARKNFLQHKLAIRQILLDEEHEDRCSVVQAHCRAATSNKRVTLKMKIWKKKQATIIIQKNTRRMFAVMRYKKLKNDLLERENFRVSIEEQALKLDKVAAALRQSVAKTLLRRRILHKNLLENKRVAAESQEAAVLEVQNAIYGFRARCHYAVLFRAYCGIKIAKAWRASFRRRELLKQVKRMQRGFRRFIAKFRLAKKIRESSKLRNQLVLAEERESHLVTVQLFLEETLAQQRVQEKVRTRAVTTLQSWTRSFLSRKNISTPLKKYLKAYLDLLPLIQSTVQVQSALRHHAAVHVVAAVKLFTECVTLWQRHGRRYLGLRRHFCQEARSRKEYEILSKEVVEAVLDAVEKQLRSDSEGKEESVRVIQNNIRRCQAFALVELRRTTSRDDAPVTLPQLEKDAANEDDTNSSEKRRSDAVAMVQSQQRLRLSQHPVALKRLEVKEEKPARKEIVSVEDAVRSGVTKEANRSRSVMRIQSNERKRSAEKSVASRRVEVAELKERRQIDSLEAQERGEATTQHEQRLGTLATDQRNKDQTNTDAAKKRQEATITITSAIKAWEATEQVGQKRVAVGETKGRRLIAGSESQEREEFANAAGVEGSELQRRNAERQGQQERQAAALQLKNFASSRQAVASVNSRRQMKEEVDKMQKLETEKQKQKQKREDDERRRLRESLPILAVAHRGGSPKKGEPGSPTGIRTVPSITVQPTVSSSKGNNMQGPSTTSILRPILPHKPRSAASSSSEDEYTSSSDEESSTDGGDDDDDDDTTSIGLISRTSTVDATTTENATTTVLTESQGAKKRVCSSDADEDSSSEAEDESSTENEDSSDSDLEH